MHFKIDLNNLIELKLSFNFTPSSSLFYSSNHLLLALFNISSSYYNNSLLNRYFIVRTLSLALNLSESLLTIHRINGSMTTVYFSCDLYYLTNVTHQLKMIIDHYYSNRLQLLPLFPLPLIEISIVRTYNPTTTTTTIQSTKINSMIEVKKVQMKVPTRLFDDNLREFNRTEIPLNNHFLFKQLYQPLVIVPLTIIAIGLCICAIIACCLCCNRQSSSSSMLLLPGAPTGYLNNKNLYRNYSYRKHKQYVFHKNKNSNYDQKQYISKGTIFI